MEKVDREKPKTARAVMQHLAYQPLLPTGNKYLQEKWDRATYDMHKRKVKSAQATINTTPPRTYAHLTLKIKTQKLEEERMLRIERENKMLLEKISHIMRTTGRIDNRNDYESKSLGRERKQQEFFRITKENQLILFRLSQCRAHYSVRDWHEDWLKNLKLMDSIARYPRGLGQGQSSKRTSSCNTKDQSPGATSQTTESSIVDGKEQNKETVGSPTPEEPGTHRDPTPDPPENCPSPDVPAKPGTPESTNHTPNKDPDTSSSSDDSERSSSSQTSHTSGRSTPETATPQEAISKDTAEEE